MMKRWKYALSLHRRSVRDALAVAAICVATYIAASTTDIFDEIVEIAKRYRNFEADDIFVVTIVFGAVMVFYALRRAQDLKLEIHKRHDAEKSARDRAKLLATVFDNVSQGILMFDAAERLVICNDYYVKMYGLSGDIVKPGVLLRGLIQHRADTGSLKRDPEEYYRSVLKLLAQKKPVDQIVETSSGREIAHTYYPMADGGWVVTHEDRTELRRREQSFRLLFDDNPVAMWLFDRNTLRFIAVNDAAIDCYGYSREQFLTMKATQTRNEDEATATAFLRGLPPIQKDDDVGQHRRADGTIFHAGIHSRIMNYQGREVRLAAITDITARKLAEAELKRAKIFLNAVIENIPMPILVKTAKDSRFTLLNKACEELFSYSREHVLGKTPHDVYAQVLADDIVRQDKIVLRTGKPIVSPDHDIMTPARGVRRVISKKVAIRGLDGRPEYILSVIDDVTERRESEMRIAHMAHSDPLTDLPNRAAFNKCLNDTLSLAEREGRSFAVLCIDLDGFKEVNDIYGHAVGDL